MAHQPRTSKPEFGYRAEFLFVRFASELNSWLQVTQIHAFFKSHPTVLIPARVKPEEWLLEIFPLVRRRIWYPSGTTHSTRIPKPSCSSAGGVVPVPDVPGVEFVAFLHGAGKLRLLAYCRGDRQPCDFNIWSS